MNGFFGQPNEEIWGQGLLPAGWHRDWEFHEEDGIPAHSRQLDLRVGQLGVDFSRSRSVELVFSVRGEVGVVPARGNVP